MVLPRQKQSVGDRAKIESDIWQVFEQHWRVEPAQAFDDGICRPARAAQMLRQSPCFRVPELDGYYPKKFFPLPASRTEIIFGFLSALQQGILGVKATGLENHFGKQSGIVY